jgi:hypothetical protein
MRRRAGARRDLRVDSRPAILTEVPMRRIRHAVGLIIPQSVLLRADQMIE